MFNVFFSVITHEITIFNTIAFSFLKYVSYDIGLYGLRLSTRLLAFPGIFNV